MRELSVCVLFLLGCSTSSMPDASDMTIDIAEDLPDDKFIDSQSDAQLTPDASLCGNGVLDGDEVCDGNAVPCNSLSALLDAGDTSCRADCTGYDIESCQRPFGSDWEIVKPALRDSKWESAQCNDGTPFDFIVKLGSSSDWVILLQGGGWADEEAFLFEGREANLITELEAPDRFHGPVEVLGGILRSDPALNERFHDANVAFAHYCSSDLWTGEGSTTRPIPSTNEDYTFRGRTNIRSMLAVLTERYGLQDDPEKKVLFGGQSAGCIGAGQTVDEVAAVLPKMAAASRIKLMADGAYIFPFADGSTWGRSALADGPLFSKALEFWSGKAVQGCAQQERGECLLGEHAFRVAKETHNVATLAIQSPFDFVVLALHGICSPGCKTAGNCLIPTCRELDAAGYDSLSTQLEQAIERGGVDWSYIHKDSLHVISGTDELWNGPLDADPEVKDVVTRFFDDGMPSHVVVNETP